MKVFHQKDTIHEEDMFSWCFQKGDWNFLMLLGTQSKSHKTDVPHS